MSSPHDESLILELDSPVATLERVGGKGASLARLAAAGLPVPPGFHITTLAYCRFVSENQLAESILTAAAQAKADDPATLDTASAQIQSLIAQGTIPDDIAASIRREYAALGGDDPPVAVRSSATAEDLPEMSFAGQQDTYLNVRGGDGVLEAVKRCWASLWTARALGYRARHGIRPEDVALAVVVQQLVPADVAGVLFTANPMTGSRDQVMINAAWGLGEAIVGGHVTPDTLTVDKPTGVIGSQEIADKDVMTVRSAGGTREEPVPADRRKQPALQPPQAAELTRLGVQIEQLYGMPMDVEWALHDGRPFILQARPITALPEPRASLDWPLPSPKGKYGRASVVELLPDPLSPLFATLALPLWNEGYRELLRAIGLSGMFPEEYLLTINDYAYYDYSRISGWRMIIALPRLVLRARDWLRRAITRWADEARPRYVAVVDAWSARDLARPRRATARRRPRDRADGGGALLDHPERHPAHRGHGRGPVHVRVQPSRPAQGRPARTDLPARLRQAPIHAEKSLYDLATWARSQPELADYLSRAGSGEIVAAYQSPSAPVADAESWREFSRRFAEHLNRFGHAVYDLDFAKSVAADEPAPLLETLKYFLTGQARNPYERQAAAAAAREEATRSLLARVKGLRRRWFTRLVPWRSATSRCARTRSPTSASAGRRSAAWSARSGGGWSGRSPSRVPTTSSG